jgi:hypothetical protein
MIPHLGQHVIDVELERLFVLRKEGEVKGDTAVMQEDPIGGQHRSTLLHRYWGTLGIAPRAETADLQ